MAISREKKVEIVAVYTDNMSKSQAVILTDFRGLSVAGLTELRRRLREVKAGFQVVKNTLFKLALQEVDFALADEYLEGPIGVGYCFDEVPPVAKALLDFVSDSGILKVRGALLGAQFLDVDGVKSIAALPAREILLAELLGSVQGPMSSLASTIMAPARELVQVLHARSEQGQQAAA